MGSSLFRNRHWYYRTLFDDYYGREARFSMMIAGFIWIPHYCYGIHLNREVEVNYAHKVYHLEYGPRRNRLCHSLCFEEFDMVLEKWMDLEDEYAAKGDEMFEGVEEIRLDEETRDF
mmetsp:Transcript_34918/g.31444  ORF Transcript_34918/g.31444 Transcript_34918/m.31444 type:complete len:117 (-) Transcript_34918:201-551(-)